MRSAISSVLVGLALLVSVAGGARADRRREPRVDDQAELRILNRVNRARIAGGLAPLRRDDRLNTLARYHSADMALGGFVALTSPTAGTLVARAVAKAAARDERHVTARVAVGTEEAVDAQALLDPSLSRVGIGVVAEGERLYVTQVAVADDSVYAPGRAPARSTLTFLVDLVRRQMLAIR